MSRHPKPFRVLNVFGLGVPVYKVKGLLKEGAYGYYEDEHKYIAVDASLKPAILEHTIIHELFHATLDRLHCQQQIPAEFVEVIVEGLSVALLDNFTPHRKKNHK